MLVWAGERPLQAGPGEVGDSYQPVAPPPGREFRILLGFAASFVLHSPSSSFYSSLHRNRAFP